MDTWRMSDGLDVGMGVGVVWYVFVVAIAAVVDCLCADDGDGQSDGSDEGMFPYAQRVCVRLWVAY